MPNAYVVHGVNGGVLAVRLTRKEAEAELKRIILIHTSPNDKTNPTVEVRRIYYDGRYVSTMLSEHIWSFEKVCAQMDLTYVRGISIRKSCYGRIFDFHIEIYPLQDEPAVEDVATLINKLVVEGRVT